MDASRDMSLNQSRDSASREDLIERLEVRDANTSRLRRYIDQLLAEVLKQDDRVATAILTGLPRVQQDSKPMPNLDTISDQVGEPKPK